MPASASRRPGASPSARLSIGQVLESVRDEFPDLSHSKLHYLEAEAHQPQRTPAGYRKYSSADVERLLFVLRAQRDRFWPLKVIKEHLLEHGVDSEVTSIASRPGPPSKTVRPPVRMSRAELAEKARVDEEFLGELEQYGMLPEGLLQYGSTELEITTAARDLADVGLHPRHLVMLRTSAEREAHMIRSVVTPRARSSNAAARGARPRISPGTWGSR